MEYLRWILAGTAMVGLLVVIHELGHFFVARWFGVGTPIFSFGIGPPMFTLARWKDTRFVISALPIGGYVQMSGADPFGEEDPDTWIEPERDFMRKPVWQRLLIMLAGPAMNLALPFVLFTAVLMGGEPQLDNSVGTVIPGSTIEGLGLRPGDRVVSAAGVETDVWADLLRVLDDHPDDAVPLRIARGAETFDVTLPAGSVVFTRDGLVDTEAIGFWQARRSSRIGVSDHTSPAYRAGLRTGDAIVSVDGEELETFDELRAALAPAVRHDVVVARVKDQEVEKIPLSFEPDPLWQSAPLLARPAGVPPATELEPDAWGIVHLGVFVGTVVKDSAAGQAGVTVGDRLVAIDGTRIRSWSDVLGLVGRTVEQKGTEDAVARELVLEVIREGQPVTLRFSPRVEREVVRGLVNFRPIMGVKQFSEVYVDGPVVEKHYWPHEAFARAVEECGVMFRQTMTVLGGLLVRDLGVGEALGGPIAIFRAAGDAAERGIFSFARMMGMISFSLGIVNLLPVPVLDGGQILFYSIEGIRGRPLPLALRERIQMIGVLLIAALFVVVMVMDVSDIFTSG